MEEELHYSTVVFKTNKVSPGESHKITTDVTSKEPSRGHDSIRSENRSKYLVLIVCLGILSLLLLSVIIHLVLHQPVRDPQREELERQVEALKSERDALNWTLNVITGMDNFPVNQYCSQKVCRPCRKGWVVFGSSCYDFSYNWKSWEESQTICRIYQAHLVTIQTPEEQEFISNQTVYYHDHKHGYWMGLKAGSQTWEDGSELGPTYWVAESPSSGCILTLGGEDRLTSWSSATCRTNNRFICESQALMKTPQI